MFPWRVNKNTKCHYTNSEGVFYSNISLNTTIFRELCWSHNGRCITSEMLFLAHISGIAHSWESNSFLMLKQKRIKKWSCCFLRSPTKTKLPGVNYSLLSLDSGPRGRTAAEIHFKKVTWQISSGILAGLGLLRLAVTKWGYADSA